MNVHTFDPLADGRWNEVVGTHPRASVFHSTGWLEALKHTYGYTPVGFTTSAPGNVLANAVVACEIRSWLTGRRLVSLPFADHCEPLIDIPAHGKAIAGELERRVDAGIYRSVECRPLTPVLAPAGSFKPAATFCFHSLDLRAPVDDLFARLHPSSIQRKIRRAEREHLRLDAGRSEAHLQKFYALLLMTRRRHQLPPQPIEWFRNLIAVMGSHLNIIIASKDGRAIAAIVLLWHQDTLVYKYGASDEAFHNTGAMPFLLWSAIQEGHRAGMHRLDLGRSDQHNVGLVTFKDRLGAERSTLRYVQNPGPSDAKRHHRWGARMAKQIAAGLPDRVLISTGRLLYRHFG